MTRRLTRRKALWAGAGAAAVAGFAGHRVHAKRQEGWARAETAIAAPNAVPLQRFEIREPEKRRFGALEFRSGLVLTSPYVGFGGFSALAMLEDGARMLWLGDQGDWFEARVERGAERRLVGLSGLRTSPMMTADAPQMAFIGRYDSEGLTVAPDGFVYVSYERVHEIWRYDLLRKGLGAQAEEVAVPPAVKKLGDNKSLEAVAAAPDGHALAGKLVTIGERPSKAFARDANPAWVVPRPGFSGGFAFSLARIDDFDVSDAAFLPSGELLVLERRFRWSEGVAMRLRRIAAAAIRPGARIEGELIFAADMAHEIDNMEGLAVHREPDGATILTMISDDNFNWFQRNLLIEFRYLG